MFKMARMTLVVPTDEPAPNLPTHITAQEVDTFFASSFFATGATDPQSRRTITLAVSPGAWPFIRDRRWGDSQRVEETPADLSQGWRRLTFTTSGLSECVHWILSFGSGVIPEGPQELIDRITHETQAMLDNLKKNRSK
jgi:predicted DNA-binding transcriptional regulator YafY